MKHLRKRTRKQKGNRKGSRRTRRTKRRGGAPIYVSVSKAESPWRDKQKIDEDYEREKAEINASYEEEKVRIENEHRQNILNLEQKNRQAIEAWRAKYPEAGHFDDDGGMPTPRTEERIAELDEDASRMETSKEPSRISSWRSWRPKFLKRNTSSSVKSVHPYD